MKLASMSLHIDPVEAGSLWGKPGMGLVLDLGLEDRPAARLSPTGDVVRLHHHGRRAFQGKP